MIVVVGSLAWRASPPAGPAGRAPRIALAAAERGATTEVVGRVGDDRSGDSLVISLAQAGVGHAAVLRDPSRATRLIEPAPDADESQPFAEAVATAEPHVAGPGPVLERADVALGLQYLTAFRVLVVTDDVPPDALPACVDGAAFAGAHLVVLIPAGREVPAGLPDDVMVLVAPRDPDDAAFAVLVGSYAAAVDAGEAPATAFRSATGTAGWEPAGVTERATPV